MFSPEEIEELCTILDGIIEHVESNYSCEEVGPSMYYHFSDNTFDIDYTCWDKNNSLSSISTIYVMLCDNSRVFVFNVIESGYSEVNGDFQDENTYTYNNLEDLIKKLFDEFGF